MWPALQTILIGALAALSLHFGFMPVQHTDAMAVDKDGCGVVMSCLPSASDACIKHCLSMQRVIRAVAVALPQLVPFLVLAAGIYFGSILVKRRRAFATQAVGPPGLIFVKHTVMRC